MEERCRIPLKDRDGVTKGLERDAGAETAQGAANLRSWSERESRLFCGIGEGQLTYYYDVELPTRGIWHRAGTKGVIHSHYDRALPDSERNNEMWSSKTPY